jgi:hypothetical protein
MLCLPHKDTAGPQTLECAFGLKDDSGRYFALADTDPAYKNVSGVPMNTQILVEGIFTPSTNSKYQDIGIIAVAHITSIENDATPPPREKSGIHGKTLLGPTCPVEQNPPDPRCADKPYATGLEVTSADGSMVIKQFSTDSEGFFTVELEAGEYAIRSLSTVRLYPRCSTNEKVEVKRGAVAETTVYCDTGIR